MGKLAHAGAEVALQRPEAGDDRRRARRTPAARGRTWPDARRLLAPARLHAVRRRELVLEVEERQDEELLPAVAPDDLVVEPHAVDDGAIVWRLDAARRGLALEARVPRLEALGVAAIFLRRRIGARWPTTFGGLVSAAVASAEGNACRAWRSSAGGVCVACFSPAGGAANAGARSCVDAASRSAGAVAPVSGCAAVSGCGLCCQRSQRRRLRGVLLLGFFRRGRGGLGHRSRRSCTIGRGLSCFLSWRRCRLGRGLRGSCSQRRRLFRRGRGRVRRSLRGLIGRGSGCRRGFLLGDARLLHRRRRSESRRGIDDCASAG